MSLGILPPSSRVHLPLRWHSAPAGPRRLWWGGQLNLTRPPSSCDTAMARTLESDSTELIGRQLTFHHNSYIQHTKYNPNSGSGNTESVF